MSKAATKMRLQEKVTILETIAAQQRDFPGYSADIAEALVDSELRMLADESRRYWRRKSAQRRSVPGTR